MSKERIYSADSALAVAEALKALSALSFRLEKFDCYLQPEALELRHKDGFRVGVLQFADEFWAFDVAYEDDFRE